MTARACSDTVAAARCGRRSRAGIYANHYFEAGLETLAAVDRDSAGSASGAPGMTEMALRRYRFDQVQSGGILNIRGRLIAGLRQGLLADLSRMKQERDAAWAACRH